MSRTERWCFCSDAHNGPEGDPATDITPGFREAWAAVAEPKLRLGDMDDDTQHGVHRIKNRIGTDVDGNHDPGSCGVRERRIGNTIVLHGDQFDPWLHRFLGRPITWLVGKAERFWPDIDVRLNSWFQRSFKAGRHGEILAYARKAAEYAQKRGAKQIVFGHLHMKFSMMFYGVRVYCTGCSCNGRMDITYVDITFDE